MENINWKVRNYQFNERQKKSIENKLYFLLKQVPCSARVSMDLEYKNKTFYGKLKVDCHGKHFFSTDENAVLSSLVSSLYKKMQKQVLKWKRTRTTEDITGIIPINKSSAPLSWNVYKKAS